MIEYVLLLIITVSIVLALISQIFKPFGDFIDSYMGSYVGCLLEYGELPTLGSDNPALADEDSECNKKFAPGSLTKGRPPRGNGNGGEGDQDGNAANRDRQGSGGDSGNSGGGGGGAYAGSSSRRGSSLINNRRRGTGVEQSAKASGGKIVEIAVDGNSGGGYFTSNNNSNRINIPQKTRAIGLSGLTEEERARIKKKAGVTAAPMVVTGGIAPEPKKMIVKKPIPEMKREEDKPITIGGFIRYLFIAALVIALVIFIGGQALQYSKSSEK